MYQKTMRSTVTVVTPGGIFGGFTCPLFTSICLLSFPRLLSATHWSLLVVIGSTRLLTPFLQKQHSADMNREYAACGVWFCIGGDLGAI